MKTNNFTEVKLAVFLLMLCGGFILAGIRLTLPTVKNLRERVQRITSERKKNKKESARDYVNRINGKTRESIFTRSRKEAQQVYNQTGQIHAYKKTIMMAWMVAACGAIIGLTMKNIFLAMVLAVGGYFLPLWWSQFALFRHEKFVNEELEIALSLITTSYTRNNDILAAVEENLNAINPPVKDTFTHFEKDFKNTNPNARALIEKMKTTLDSKIFRQWCDALILCQEDQTLRATLPPIVNKFSTQKAQQMANETKMMMPIRNAAFMICITLSIIPIFKIVNEDWFLNLSGTMLGQFTLVITAVITLITINKAIKISRPIEYDV